MFGLLGGVPAEAATAVMSDPLRTLENHAPLINQTEDRAIVKVAEWCGTGSFRDEYGRCRYYGCGAPLITVGDVACQTIRTADPPRRLGARVSRNLADGYVRFVEFKLSFIYLWG